MDVIARRSAGLMSFVERYRRVAELPEPKPQAIEAAALIGSLRQLTAALFETSGVTLARQIAVAHGGELSARRNEAGGATFILALPVRT